MTVLYGIPNCDTVKKARRWLDEHGITYRFHNFRTDGLTSEQVSHWLAQSGLERVINKRSTTWKNLSPEQREGLNEQTAVALILDQPTLIKRPLLEIGDQLHLGFNADSYSALFG